MILRRAFIGLMLLALAVASQADSQFYFIAQQAAQGSLTAPGQDKKRVYLRWDLVEGSVPEDIIGFSLYRDGELLKSFPGTGVMSPVQIAALYQSDAEERRLLETVSQMKEEALLDDSRLDFASSDFAEVIHLRLKDPEELFWAHQAARMDFNIAVARYRGYHDEPEWNGEPIEYELIAHNAEGLHRRVGLVSVNLDQPQTLLPPEHFEQIMQSSCDLPDFRDHFSVALNWDLPGAENMADRLANQLFISGYDLYRSRVNVSSAPERDLAAEAAALPHDNQGRVLFDDLERVNDTPLTIAPDNDRTVPEWLETRPDLMAAGLQPGDRRAYYLVPRDVAGQYGPTVSALVRVEDQSRPPAPWGITPYLNESAQRVELMFNQVNLNAYRNAYSRERRFCNLNTADQDGYLEFVGQEEDCATDVRRRVQIDVEEYLVYRFENFAEASAFKDSDGDGFSDADERPDNLQCVPAEKFGGFRIAAEIEQVEADSGAQMLAIDETPAQAKGDVYWYRIASRSKAGRLSLLSEPVRVNFPDRTLPEPPLVEVTQPGTEICDCEVETTADKQWTFLDEVNLSGVNPSLQCGSGTEYDLSPSNISDSKGALCGSSSFVNDCGSTNNRVFTYDAGDGQVFSCCLPPSHGGTDMCGAVSMRVKPVSCESQVPAPEGVVEGPLLIRVTAVAESQCVTLRQQISGETVTLGTSCSDGSFNFEYEHRFGEFCGYAISHDGNNNTSATTQIGCRSVPGRSDIVLSPPQPVSMIPLEASMGLEWRVPSQTQSLVEIELQRQAPSGLEPIITSIPAVELSGGGLQDWQLDIPELAADEEEWCVRMRTFAPSATVGRPHYSAWSAPLCEVRLIDPGSAPPEWLPWPQLAEVPEGEPLMVESSSSVHLVNDQVPLRNGFYISLGDYWYANSEDCNTPVYARGVVGDLDLNPPQSGLYLTELNCIPSGYGRFQDVMAEQTAFMVFRQARAPSGQTSDFVQVSPMIDYVHWVPYKDPKETQVIGYRLRDPYIWAFGDGDYSIRIELAFYDRSGLVEHHEYRYQFVYFDQDNRMRQWRATDWVTYVLPVTDEAGGDV